MVAISPRRGRRVAFGIALACLAARPGLAASYRTANFAVEAPTADAAKKVGDHAERCRKSIAKSWLGRELPAWKTPCPIRVKLTGGEAGGVTIFDFGNGGVAGQRMSVEGRLDRILASSLPHEVTHTIFAAHFGGPMPRWADEGASLLSEDRRETDRQDRVAEDLLTSRGDLPLARLFRMEEYPNDPHRLLGFYGQGYSVSRFLTEIGGRPRFLRFVRDGSRSGWDAAAGAHYGLADVQELDRAWRSWHKVGVADARARPESLAARAASPADARRN